MYHAFFDLIWSISSCTDGGAIPEENFTTSSFTVHYHCGKLSFLHSNQLLSWNHMCVFTIVYFVSNMLMFSQCRMKYFASSLLTWDQMLFQLPLLVEGGNTCPVRMVHYHGSIFPQHRQNFVFPCDYNLHVEHLHYKNILKTRVFFWQKVLNLFILLNNSLHYKLFKFEIKSYCSI